eukprot:882850-Pelagomonas_calceolata.AAC.2
MYVTFKDKGIDFAKQAVEADERGEVDKAIDLYLKSLEYFKTYLKYEKNEKSKEAIKSKVCAGTQRGGKAQRMRNTSTHPGVPPTRVVHLHFSPFEQFHEYLVRAEYLKGLGIHDSNGQDHGAAAATKVRKPGQAGGKEEVGAYAMRMLQEAALFAPTR